MKEFEYEFAESLYYTASEFEKKGGIWPIRAGRNQAKPGYAIGPKIIECYSIHFVAEGAVEFEFKGGAATLEAGDLFCLYPHHKYRYELGKGGTAPLRMYWLAFNGPQAPYLLDRLGISRERPYLRGRLTPDTEAALQETLRFIRSGNAGEECLLSASIYRIFGALHDPSACEQSDKGEEKWTARTLNHMHTHYMEGITVADVVRVAGVHRSHLYGELTRLTGMGPQQYLTKLRMERAAEMLQLRAYSITEIALSLGYPELYSFSRAFCKHYGMPPSRYPRDKGMD
ncbi:AraC family transcriptional regulator [Paenibacillus sacheonensis]|uniref:Helix-turn-helix domain-containing protein n=1 Tax=Paenibacillus sacheonensis TaxID=742054 RepID=A0A7X4YQK5_9BACL|nr:AraC family transcriptional regulator [Paenibacillus sacheonensis]MBM7567842.1 AraC-like DNA-binding protein [Paenibacillus sacheonensis]NBC70730.1 helix-turn-helix domain-containing protein [Paenibacillus sacheonensis]